MPAATETEKSATEAEVAERRKRSERRFRSIMDGEAPHPSLIYPWLDPSELLPGRSQKRGTMVVSLHTQSYFLLLLALDECGLACTAITTEQLANRLRHSCFQAGMDTRFESHLYPNSIRDCLRGDRYFFIMADVLSPTGPNTMIPVFGRAMVYTVSWARMALRLELNVVAAVLSDRGKSASIALRSLEGPFDDEFALAAATFKVFGDALGDDLSSWENEPLWAAYSAPLPDMSPDQDEALIRELHLRSACDHAVSRRFLEIRRDFWPGSL